MSIQQVSVSKYADPLFYGGSVTVPRPADMQNDDFNEPDSRVGRWLRKVFR